MSGLSPQSAYKKRWMHERNQGIFRTVDAEPVRMHIMSLRGAGMSLRAIAAAAGVSPQVVASIQRGQRSAKRTTATALLAVEFGIVRKGWTDTTEPFVPKLGAVRRIQALIALGWPHHELSARSGVRTSCVMNQQGRWITLTTFQAIEQLYDDLSMTPGPSNLSRGWACRLGYAPPLAWDDIDNDEAVPLPPERIPRTREPIDEVAVQRALDGKKVALSKADRHEVARRWQASGRSLIEMERVTGVHAHRYLEQETT